jgi:hypothetical protein
VPVFGFGGKSLLSSPWEIVIQNEYLIFLDESVKRGSYFSNFYGGVIVGGVEYERVTKLLEAKKKELNFHGEVKWQKVSAPYLSKYIALIQAFFAEVIAGKVRVRIMFRQNAHTTRDAISNDSDSYFKLYYQFVKHAFGLRSMPVPGHRVNLRLLFDDIPESRERRTQFKGYILGLASNREMLARQIQLTADNISEVRSHDHCLLQCLDVILGAMAFRLNDMHKEKIPGKRRRGKKTIAKEKLYKAIHAEIVKIRPRFNIGISTGMSDSEHGKWSDAYRHWRFVANGAEWDSTLTKP